MQDNIKTIIALLVGILGLSLPATAQSWHPLPANRLLLYSFQQQGSADEWFFAMHADSVRAEGADSAYYLYRLDRPLVPSDSVLDCNGFPISLQTGVVLSNRDHLLGRKFLVKPSGDCLFISSDADTFLLQTQSPTGATWSCNGAVTATVDSVVASDVLGAPDSLKYIHLSNNDTWILSKAHGLVQWHNLLPFPDLSGAAADLEFRISGIPTLALGESLPHYGAFFQFDPGDRFGIATVMDFTPGRIELWRDIRIVSHVSGTRFQYNTLEESLRYETPLGGPIDTTYTAPGPHVLSFDSTGYESLALLPYQHQPVIPFFFGASCQAGFHRGTAYHGRIQMDFELKSEFDTCAQAHFAPNPDGHQYFVAGLGEVSYEWETVMNSTYRTLYCYEKGSETWGNCLDLSAISALAPSLESQISLRPNPASNELVISLPSSISDAPHQFALYDLQGHPVQAAMTQSGTTTALDLRTVPAGVYLLRLSASGYEPVMRRVIIAR